MTFEQLFKEKLKKDLADIEGLKGFNILVVNDYSSEARPGEKDVTIVINSGAGTPLALQGTTAISQALNINLLVHQNHLQEWLTCLTEYIYKTTGTVGSVEAMENYNYSINYSTPSVVSNNIQRGTNYFSLVSLIGNLIYTDSLAFGNDLKIYFDSKELINILTWNISSNNAISDVADMASYQNEYTLEYSSTTILLSISLNENNTLHKELIAYAINPSDKAFDINLDMGNGIGKVFKGIIRTITINGQTDAFSTMQITLESKTYGGE